MSLHSQRRGRMIAVAIFTLLFIGFVHLEKRSASEYSLRSLPTTHKYAYCTFLSPIPGSPGDTLYNEDHYLAGVRMLAYQLLHDPTTRSQSSVPLIVMVTTEVPRSTRERLAKDGAFVVEVSPIEFGWIKPGRERWKHVMDKLHVFEMAQFEKILLLDSDIVIVKPLDALFDDPTTDLQQNHGQKQQQKPDEAPQPPEYIMAGIRDSGMGLGLNAGFAMLRPSMQMYRHYLSIAAIEGRFNASWPEQGLWNYVHRLDGNMPWKQIPEKWTVNSPWYHDFENGTASFHEKYWGCGRDKKLRDVLLRSRFEMEGYFQARDILDRRIT